MLQQECVPKVFLILKQQFSLQKYEKINSYYTTTSEKAREIDLMGMCSGRWQKAIKKATPEGMAFLLVVRQLANACDQIGSAV
jgi:hypothetical protein